MNHCLQKPWVLGALMSLLYGAAILFCFWEVLAPDVVFVAPDAPIEPYTFGNALARLFALPSLQNLVQLLPPRLSYEGTFWVDGYVMCLAAVFLLRGRGISWGAAWVGGLCAAFAGYFFTLFCAGHRGVVDALAVTCLGFGALQRAIRTGAPGWYALLGAFAALGLGAQADICFIVLLALAAYALWLIVVERPRWTALLLGALIAAAVFFGLGHNAIRHTLGAARQTRTIQLQQAEAAVTAAPGQPPQDVHWDFITGWSLPPEDLAELLIPAIHGHTSYPFDPDPYTGRMGGKVGTQTVTLRQHTIHIGLPALALALLALGLRLRRRDDTARDLPFWLGLALVATLLALGCHTPLYRAVAAVPVLDQIRAPVKWFHLTGFAVAILAGLGADALVRRLGNRAALILGVIVVGWGAFVARPYVFPRDLSLNPLLAALPEGATIGNGAGWPELPNLCAWHGIPYAPDPRQADCLVVFIQPNLPPPLATHKPLGAPRPLALIPWRAAGNRQSERGTP